MEKNGLPFKIDEIAHLGARKIVGLGMEAAFMVDQNTALVYADVGSRFNLNRFMEKANLCLNVGIAEQSMIDIAAGIAHEGITVFAASYAPFIIGRAFDQIKAAVGEMCLPIKLIGAPSGLGAGDLGSLSICIDDIAMMRTIPNLIVTSPADCLEAIKCIQAAAKTPQPVYIRITGGKYLMPVYQEDYVFELGKAVPLREGKRLLVISTGTITSQVLEATDRLSGEGTPVAVLNIHTVKPLDTQALERYISFDAFVTVEEHSIFGGLGSAVAEYLAPKRNHPILCQLGIADRYFAADHYENLLEEAGLSAEKIYKTLKGLLVSTEQK